MTKWRATPEAPAPQIVDPCDPCETINAQAGAVGPCLDSVPETTGAPATTGVPATDDTDSAGGGALLVTSRRTPEVS